MTHYIRKPKDFISGLILLTIGVGALFLLRDYQFGTTRRMGPAYFPTILAGLLTFLAATLVIRSLQGVREAMEVIPLRPAFFILGGPLLFALLIRPAGLILATVPMVLMGVAASAQIRLPVALATAAVLATGSALIFVYALGQPIPVLGYWFRS